MLGSVICDVKEETELEEERGRTQNDPYEENKVSLEITNTSQSSKTPRNEGNNSTLERKAKTRDAKEKNPANDDKKLWTLRMESLARGTLKYQFRF